MKVLKVGDIRKFCNMYVGVVTGYVANSYEVVLTDGSVRHIPFEDINTTVKLQAELREKLETLGNRCIKINKMESRIEELKAEIKKENKEISNDIRDLANMSRKLNTK
jgi:predicted RNase H-like nuclease (RuvC/YqgF family)